MARVVFFRVLVLAVIANGCGDDAAPIDASMTDAGTDARPDASSDVAVDSPVLVDAGSDVAPDAAGGLGADCLTDDDCTVGTCNRPFAGADLGNGYCQPGCTTDVDCEAIEDGRSYVCETGSCFRSCDNGFGCPGENEVCFDDLNLGGFARADTCIDFSAETCESNGDCEPEEYCGVASDREKFVAVCFTPRTPAGVPSNPLRPGDACDPRSNVGTLNAVPCEAASACPAGWGCTARPSDGARVCTPPPTQACFYSCSNQNRCPGLCSEDSHCPSDMICSVLNVQFPAGPAPGVVDDGIIEIGFCNDARGSRTTCAKEADCAATGAGGAREICAPYPNAAGVVAPICITPPLNSALPGEACGDDLSTPEYEVRNCGGLPCFDSQCSESCVANADCDAGEECRPLLVSADETYGFCAPVDACVTDSDCGAGETCFATSDGTGAGFRQCLTNFGDLDHGAACRSVPNNLLTPAERCRGACFDDGAGAGTGLCGSVCAVDGDCVDGQICGTFQQTLTNGGTPFDRSDDVTSSSNLCIPGVGSLDVCTTSTECGAAESCAAAPTPAGERRACLADVPAGAAPGEACSATVACAGRYSCISSWSDASDRFCTALCGADGDCPADTVCRQYSESGPLVSGQCIRADDPRGLAL